MVYRCLKSIKNGSLSQPTVWNNGILGTHLVILRHTQTWDVNDVNQSRIALLTKVARGTLFTYLWIKHDKTIINVHLGLLTAVPSVSCTKCSWRLCRSPGQWWGSKFGNHSCTKCGSFALWLFQSSGIMDITWYYHPAINHGKGTFPIDSQNSH